MRNIIIAISLSLAFPGFVQAQHSCLEIQAADRIYYASSESSGEFYRTRENCEEEKQPIGLFWQSGKNLTAACDKYGLSTVTSLESALRWVLNNCPEAQTPQILTHDRREYFDDLNRKISQLQVELETVSSFEQRGIILKKMAELIFEKAVFDSNFLIRAIEAMEMALEMFESSGNDVKRAETLTALGNLKQRIVRPLEAYEHYEAASKLAKDLDFDAYFEAELNRCTLCCQRLIDEDPEFQMMAYISQGRADAKSCCTEALLKLMDEAKKQDKIDLAFVSYRQIYFLEAYAASKRKAEIKTGIEDRVVTLAIHLLEQMQTSPYRLLAAETILQITGKLSVTRSRKKHQKVINWLSACIHEIKSLNSDLLFYQANRQLGLARKMLFIEPEKAIDNFERASTLGKKLNVDILELREIFSALIEIQIGLGSFDEAESAARRALEWSEEIEKLTYVWHMMLGNVSDIRGDYTLAIQEYELALKNLAKDGMEYQRGNIYYNMSFTYQNIGEYEEAEHKLKNSLKAFGAAFAQLFDFEETHPIPSVDANREYYIQKDLEFVESLAKKGITKPSQDRTLVRLMNDIWNCYEELARIAILRHRLQTAEENYLKAGKWFQRVTLQFYIGQQEQIYGSSGTTLGLCRLNLMRGDTEKARTYLDHYNTKLHRIDPMSQQIINKIKLLLLQGELEFLENKIELAEKTLGEAFSMAEANQLDVEKADALRLMAHAHNAKGEHDKAFETFVQAVELENEIYKYVMFLGSDQAKLNFMISHSESFQALMSLFNQHFMKEAAKLNTVFNLLQTRKGIVFEAQTRILDSVKLSFDYGKRDDLSKLAELRAMIARLVLGHSRIPRAELQKRLRTYKEEANRLERELSKSIQQTGLQLHMTENGRTEIAKKLGRDGLLVEFLLVPEYEIHGKAWTKRKKYLAFLLNNKSQVKCIDLGYASVVDKLWADLSGALRRQIGRWGRGVRPLRSDKQDKEADELLKNLYEKIWLPIEKEITGTKIVAISPDGLLNLIPMGSLVGIDGKYLVEHYSLIYISVGRDLLRKKPAEKFNQQLLLIANPDFDFKEPKREQKQIEPRTFRTRSRSMVGSFAPLDGTDKEAKKISVLVDKNQRQVFLNKNAKEGEVKNAKDVRILHLATHGFFIESANILREGLLPVLYIEENPLLRSALAFAGANNAQKVEREDDGILTAYEITGIDLRNTELVTLSACETGVGEVRSGEGVFGLRRAFALSGARNLMLSLWPVHDDVTADQMIDFYKRYLSGKSPAIALREAQLNTIAELKKNFGIAPVALWAPFILQSSSLSIQTRDDK